MEHSASVQKMSFLQHLRCVVIVFLAPQAVDFVANVALARYITVGSSFMLRKENIPNLTKSTGTYNSPQLLATNSDLGSWK
jgi:hypothetical protein